MPQETVRYDRNTLYQQVWTEPVQKVAKGYGISDVICKDLRVPTPGRGISDRRRIIVRSV
jgi:hypothetical protein